MRLHTRAFVRARGLTHALVRVHVCMCLSCMCLWEYVTVCVHVSACACVCVCERGSLGRDCISLTGGCCRRGRLGRLSNGLGRSVVLELCLVPQDGMRDYRARRYERFESGNYTADQALRHGAASSGRLAMHRQHNTHVR